MSTSNALNPQWRYTIFLKSHAKNQKEFPIKIRQTDVAPKWNSFLVWIKSDKFLTTQFPDFLSAGMPMQSILNEILKICHDYNLPSSVRLQLRSHLYLSLLCLLLIVCIPIWNCCQTHYSITFFSLFEHNIWFLWFWSERPHAPASASNPFAQFVHISKCVCQTQQNWNHSNVTKLWIEKEKEINISLSICVSES